MLTEPRTRFRGWRTTGGGWVPLLLVVLSLPAACRAPVAEAPPTPPGAAPAPETPAAEPFFLDELDAESAEWVERTLASMGLRELAGQLVFPWVSGGYASLTDPEFVEVAGWVSEGLVGGVMLSIGTPHAYAARLNALQERARVPLLVTSDFESGGPGMRIHHSYALPSLLPQGGGTSFPPTMAFGATGDTALTREMARATALEARAVGVHLAFAPVLDVNSNPENPIINTRAFGEDPEAVADHGRAFLRGARQGGVLTTAKHFPGHGDTRTDSHIELPVVPADRERLDRLELVPFRAAVSAGVDAIMTAHVAMPALLGEDGPPATFAPEIMTDLLREEMGFGGLLFTDALRMGAIAERYGVAEAAVRAVEAGADVLLVPEDVPASVDAVVEAVEEGRFERGRLESSVRRILEAKARVGLPRGARVSLDRIPEVVGSAPHRALADSAAVRSLTLPRDREGLVPLDPEVHRRVLSVTFARPDDLVAGAAFDLVLEGYLGGVDRVRLDERSRADEYDAVAVAADSADLVVVSVYVPPRAGAGSVDVPATFARLVEAIDTRRPTVVVSLGSPYLLDAFPGVGSYLLAWGDREVAQEAAARALAGAVPIDGRLPVSLPPHHRAGEGLVRHPVPAVADRHIRGREVLATQGLVPPPRVPDAGTRPPRALPDPDGLLPGERFTADGGVASELEAPASAAGMSEERLRVLDGILRRAVLDSVAPGVAVAVGRRGELVRLRGYGRLDWDPTSPPATPSSIYDLASLTKVVGTTAALMLLADEERLSLDDPVAMYVPGWAGSDLRREAVTVRDLLLHRSGLPAYRRFFEEARGPRAFREALLAVPLVADPPARTDYSDIGFKALGLVVEEVAGMPLDRFLEQRFWEPLEMSETLFRPPLSLLPRIAPTEVDRENRFRHIHGEVHDENAFAMGGVAGHAGLFSSARDLARFTALMMEGGALPGCRGVEGVGRDGQDGDGAPQPPEDVLLDRRPGGLCIGGDGVRLLGEETVRLFTRRHGEDSSRALGWDTPSGRSSAGDYFSARSFGHTGFTGTSIWVDPELDLFVVLLTNRVNPSRENTRHIQLRRDVHDAVARAVADREVRRRH